ncbi:MAG: low affinity iron permease family protein [Deltaproteobacteria bacterium]|nr:low affinity iron permease family protein [Deltaproteobacteria bacterium]
MKTKKRESWFNSFAKWASHKTGHPAVFTAAIVIIVLWGVTGPVFGFSDTWQLIINTGTTIITFLMVFIIQNTQNRDTGAMQVKLDELIRAVEGAHKALLDLEELDDQAIEKIRKKYKKLAASAREDLKNGKADTDTEDVVPEKGKNTASARGSKNRANRNVKTSPG